MPSSVPTWLPFGSHYCQDFNNFGMVQPYTNALTQISNATYIDDVNCSDDTTNNFTARISARAHFYADVEIRRELGEDVVSVGYKINDRVKKRMINGTLFTRLYAAAVSTSRRLARRHSDFYAYTADDAIGFVTAAHALSVETHIIGTIGPTSVPTSYPTPIPTLPPTSVPTVTPTSVPTFVPTTVPTAMPSPYPTAQCPTWATTQDCPDNCLCCTKYNYTAGINGTMQLGARKPNKASPHSTCLICYHDYECVDVDYDGDGECVYNTTSAEGADPNNLCDWWLWAWNYGPSNDHVGLANPNGHYYQEDFVLSKSHYMVGGQNCSSGYIEIIKDTAPGRSYDGTFHSCNGLFSQGNNTQYASGDPFTPHDREGSICYKDYRDPDYRGYCSYEVGPSACARCLDFPVDVLVVAGEMVLTVQSGQTAAELNSNKNFTFAMKKTIFFASGLDEMDGFDSNKPEDYIKNLLIEEATRRRRALLSAGSVMITYDIVVSPKAITISAGAFSQAIAVNQNSAVATGSFNNLLVNALADLKTAGIKLNVTAVSTIQMVTIAPTFWSDTAESVVPPVIQRRIGGEKNLPPCDCDDKRA